MQVIVKKKCKMCPRIGKHCHYEGRVYFMDEEQEEMEFKDYFLSAKVEEKITN